MSKQNYAKIVGSMGLALGMLSAAPHPLHAAEPPATLTGSRPNIIFILSDDQGYGDLGRNGNPILKTPALDRLYDEGVRFSDFHVSPTCSPSRCSIMTGRHEFHSGVTHTIFERERMSLKATTIAQVLKTAGYATGIFGKWHLGDEAPYQPNNRGFDEVFIHGGGGIGQTYPGTCGDAPGNKYFDPCILHNGTFEKTRGYCTDVFFGQAEKWIQQAKDKQPFFAYIATNVPHAPLQCPPDMEKLYDGKVPRDTAKFFGMITTIDNNVTTLLGKLKEWGIENNTLLVFMNDNGGTHGCQVFNAGMRGQKGTAFNGGTRAMSLWRWPGTIKPGTCDRLTAHIDLFPTFAELAGAKLPEETASKLEGFSLLPLLQDPAGPGHDQRVLYTHVGRWEPGTPPKKLGRCSVRWQQYLMTYERQWCLYDLKQDPGEQSNIAAAHPDIVARLTQNYDQWWTQTLPELVNEDAYKTAPRVNPFRALYFKQFGGPGPNNVSPNGKTAPEHD